MTRTRVRSCVRVEERDDGGWIKGEGEREGCMGKTCFASLKRGYLTRCWSFSLSSVLDAIKKIPRIGEPNSVVPKLVPLSLDLELADRFIRCFSMPFRKVELDSSFQRRRKPLMFDPSMRKWTCFFSPFRTVSKGGRLEFGYENWRFTRLEFGRNIGLNFKRHRSRNKEGKRAKPRMREFYMRSSGTRQNRNSTLNFTFILYRSINSFPPLKTNVLI